MNTHLFRCNDTDRKSDVWWWWSVGRKEERIHLEVVRRLAAYSFDLDLAVATVSWQTVGK
jgi:hypothetical protein